MIDDRSAGSPRAARPHRLRARISFAGMQTVTVTLADGSTSRYVLAEERPDGSLVIRRPTFLEQLLAEDDSQPLSDPEFECIVLPRVAPGDDEG